MRRIQRLVVSAVLGLAVVAAAPSVAWAQKAVIVVRHAERVDESEDSPLSPAGLQRAQTLARMLGRIGIKRIFVSQFQRTQQTAAPLAAALKLMPVVMSANTSQPVVERIRRENPNDVVLIVGHSNTVPAILKQFGHPELIEIPTDEFDSLFVLVPQGQGPPTVLRLRY
jgi:broad specificity phosphatase PhoE